MPRIHRPTKEEKRKLRGQLSERAHAAQLRLPEAISEIRRALGLTRPEFAKLFRLTRRQLQEMEQGKANPTAETLNRVGKVFGFTLGFVPRAEKSDELEELERATERHMAMKDS